MTQAKGETPISSHDGSWRDRALERSLRSARAKAMSRSDRFIETAMELLRETGRVDFTVQELVDRSRTSLRSFYQYFSGKDELLLALLEESIATSVERWREQIEGKDALASLEIVVRGVYGSGEAEAESLSRGLAPYHASLAESHSEDYHRAISPMARLVHEITEQGIRDGVFRTDVPPELLIRVFLEAVIGSALFTALGNGELTAEATDAMWEFCRAGLVGPSEK